MALPTRVDDSAPPYGTLVFDCDSTLSAIEGIDELAGPRKAEIAALTERAMAGEVPLEAVYGRRLELLRPTREQVAALGQQYVAAALPHALELVRALKALRKRVCILSGGLRQAVFALADHLQIDSGDVFAVDIFMAAMAPTRASTRTLRSLVPAASSSSCANLRARTDAAGSCSSATAQRTSRRLPPHAASWPSAVSHAARRSSRARS